MEAVPQLTPELRDLVSVSNVLKQWFTGFKRKFGSNPKETGITDQLLMGLPDWVEATPTTGDVEGREGHDFTLKFTYQGRLCTLYMQAKNIHNDTVIDFIAGYRTIDEPTKGSMSRPHKDLLRKLRDLRLEIRAGNNEAVDERDKLERQLERLERDEERRAKEEEEKISLQPDRLHRAICANDDGPTVQ
ncbi:hypothetical protein FRC06_010040, partial [Ceratobasidium sp. 370]